MTSLPTDQVTNASWLIETKLAPPVSNSDLIDRPIAMRAIEEIHDHKAGFVIAPAGYGKTSLLAQWTHQARTAGVAVAWLSLDRNDGEIHRFASYCIAAISRSGVSLGQLELAAEQFLVETATVSIVPRLVTELSKIDRQIVLILDDYHLAESPGLSNFTSSLVAYSPVNLKILISSRTIPDIGMSSLIASRQAFEIGVDMLRFSSDEMRSFAGDAFDESALNIWEAETEGWAVAVQLAKLAGRDPRAHKTLPPNQRDHIANYLVQQILDHCSPNERRFLLSTSILDRFTPGLAAKVCSRAVSNDVLQNSALVRPLLVRLDSEEQWYRYHHLFSELLYDVLKNSSPELLPDLHQSASAWFEEKGDIVNAVSHAAKSGDVDRAAQLVLDAGGWELALFGDVSLLRTLMGNFTIDDMQRFPRLRMAYALALMKDGSTGDSAAQLGAIELGRNYGNLTERERRDYIAVKAHLDTYQDAIYANAPYETFDEMLKTWPAHDARGVGPLQALVTMGANARWQFDAATATANAGVSSMRRANSVLGISYCYAHLGQTAFYRGDTDLANAHLEEAAHMAEDNFGADSRLKVNCDIVLHAIRYWRDDRSIDAGFLLSRLEIACDTDSWFDIYYTGFSSLLDHACMVRDADLAQNILDLCKATARRREIIRLDLLVPSFELSVAMAAGNERSMLLAARKVADLHRRFDDGFGLHANSIPLAESILISGRLGDAVKLPDAAMSSLDRITDFAAERGAGFFLVRLLVLRARIRADARGNQAGMADMLKAARHAVRTSIRTPFIASSEIVALVRATVRFGRDKPEHRLEVAFLNDCLASAVSRRYDGARPDKKLLSAREADVLTELSIGQSNKEIARVLDMTDHTVKFHLKNIFEKLGVDNRVSAVNAGRGLDLIP